MGRRANGEGSIYSTIQKVKSLQFYIKYVKI